MSFFWENITNKATFVENCGGWNCRKIAVLLILCQGYLGLILPSTNILVVQNFKRLTIIIFSLLLFLGIIATIFTSLYTIYICAFLLFWFSLNIFSTSFQWFMLLLPVVIFPFSSSISQSSTWSVASSSFLQIGHIGSLSFFWVVHFYILHVQFYFQCTFYVTCIRLNKSN